MKFPAIPPHSVWNLSKTNAQLNALGIRSDAMVHESSAVCFILTPHPYCCIAQVRTRLRLPREAHVFCPKTAPEMISEGLKSKSFLGQTPLAVRSARYGETPSNFFCATPLVNHQFWCSYTPVCRLAVSTED